MPLKIRQLKAILLEAGFTSTPGKGSHVKWQHPLSNKLIVIARQDGEDAPRYLEKQVRMALQELENLKGTEYE